MNDLIVYGLNYHSCPVAVRERFTIPESCLEHALAGLKRLPHVVEAVVLSTCNRTEVYAVVSNVSAGFKELESFFKSAREIADHQTLQANFKLLHSDVTLHLMRVASGLDSMVLGEGQIMSQIKAAHQAALRAGTAGARLDGLFKAALHCGKKVRSQTSLGRRAVSISSAAVELTRKLLGDFNNRKICVIGAGRMGQICIKLLLTDNNNCFVYVVNRSESKTKALLAANTRHLDRLKIVEDFSKRYEIVPQCDAVIVAASAPGFLLTPEGLATTALPPVTALHVIDMSVPRNVDPRLGEVDGIRLHNFDDLAFIVKQNMAEREALTKDAEAIIFSALKDFEHREQALMAVPVIAQLRGKVEDIRLSHLRRHSSSKRQSKHSVTKHINQQLDKVSRILVNEILHKPTTKLKAAKDYQSLQKQSEVLRSLFDLES